MTPSDASPGRIDPEQSRAALRRLVGPVFPALEAEIEVIDGKTIPYASWEVRP